MRRNYLESMKSDGLGEFLSACESLKNCKYVLAESKITALLKSIADNKQLYSMFAASLYEFDYSKTFSACIYNGSFVLPTEPKKAIALVFRILMDIDCGKIELRNFLEAYFYSPMINESYARFCLEVITPFRSYCNSLFSQPTLLQELPVKGSVYGAYEAVNGKFRTDLKSDALGCIATLVDIADSTITGAIERAEYTACLNGLTRAIDSDDYENIISAFLGVKYAVAYFFKSTKTVMDIYKKLEYDIKHIAD
ncbi:MAG: hypothetical protein K2F90_01505 [Clostridiales bacterium]|nr:hypothetical protein [Clostridiales bacterium]